MTLDTQKLRALAEAVTQPGPWYVRKTGDIEIEHTIVDNDLMWLADLGASPKSDADYIAACSPDVIIQLLDALEAMAAARDDALADLGTTRAILVSTWNALDKACDLAESLAEDAREYGSPPMEVIAALRAVGGAK